MINLIWRFLLFNKPCKMRLTNLIPRTVKRSIQGIFVVDVRLVFRCICMEKPNDLKHSGDFFELFPLMKAFVDLWNSLRRQCNKSLFVCLCSIHRCHAYFSDFWLSIVALDVCVSPNSSLDLRGSSVKAPMQLVPCAHSPDSFKRVKWKQISIVEFCRTLDQNKWIHRFLIIYSYVRIRYFHPNAVFFVRILYDFPLMFLRT